MPDLPLFNELVAPPTELIQGTLAGALLQKTRPEIGISNEHRTFLAQAGVYGSGYGGDGWRAFDRSVVEEVNARPFRRLEELADEPLLADHDVALILRLVPAHAVAETYEADDPHARTFAGIHADIERSPEARVRQAADNAVREFWPISAARRQVILDAVASVGFLPLVLTVGKYVLGARDVVGFNDPGRGGKERGIALTVRPASAWAVPFIDTWLDSGRGRPTAWWDRDRSAEASAPARAN